MSHIRLKSFRTVYVGENVLIIKTKQELRLLIINYCSFIFQKLTFEFSNLKKM